VFWADDSSTGGYALREGSIECTVAADPVPTPDPTPTLPVDPLPETGTPQTPTAPVANPGATTPVASTEFTATARGDVDAPSTVRPGDTVTISVGVEHAGETVNVWLHSTPVLLATTVVAADGTVRVVIPADAPAGAHRIAVLAADGTLIGWDNVTVAAVRLAATGTDVSAPVAAALLMLLAGIGITVMRRRPRVTA
jgi:hypothetical protein